MNDYAAILVAILLVIAIFAYSTKYGVVKILASGIAALLGIAVFFLGVRWFPGIAENSLESYTWKTIFGAAAGAALIVYVIVRVICGQVLRVLLGPDSWLHPFADGFLGGVLSLFTSFVIVLFLFLCVRISGTVLELNYVASLSRDQIVQEPDSIPSYPVAASWRNMIDSIPLVAPSLDFVDPFGNRAYRNGAAFLMVSQSSPIRSYFLSQPETAELAGLRAISSLATEPEIFRALEEQKRIELVLHPTLQERIDLSPYRDELAKVRLRPILEGFVDSIPRPEPVPQNSPGIELNPSR